ncbi:MAG: hypothetical protein Q9168_002458 [Polycauliona sp. 1 TL-2023]
MVLLLYCYLLEIAKPRPELDPSVLWQLAHASGQDFSTPLDLPVVSIPKVDHDNLLQMAHEYMSLRDALHRGGIAQETLETLIRGPNDTEGSAPIFEGSLSNTRDGQRPIGGVRVTHPHGKEADHRFLDSPSRSNSPANGLHRDRPSSGLDKNSFAASFARRDGGVPLYAPKSDDQSDRKKDQRTILLQNLPDTVTHKDIVDIVRGGMLLDVYLRTQDKSASISFVDGSSAQAFLSHAKRNGLYIRGRRLILDWSERQFYMPGHVAGKIRIGATRNLIIRSVKPNITEERLREDLDHIHNLIIISISYIDGNVYLSLNSIHNALFARTCMMSRAMYKGMKIEWYPDECALPLPKTEHTVRKEPTFTPKLKTNPMVNRFQMLNMDDDATEDGSAFEDGEDDTMSTGFSPLKESRRHQWDLSTAAA